MSDVLQKPWLTIVGLGEDGISGLSEAARTALAEAEIVTGAVRHLGLLSGLSAECRPWPVPFADGVAPLLALRGRRVVLLASGDPFWFGAGTVVTRDLAPGEWTAHPGASTFALAAARLGWALEATLCMGLHAAPLAGNPRSSCWKRWAAGANGCGRRRRRASISRMSPIRWRWR